VSPTWYLAVMLPAVRTRFAMVHVIDAVADCGVRKVHIRCGRQRRTALQLVHAAAGIAEATAATPVQHLLASQSVIN
jgi:hypothetical protein